MIREELQKREWGRHAGFRMRGGDVSRVEGFSDAVFGFALTLLVVSLEVPRTFGELLATMRGFVAFAIVFFILLQVWYSHYLFFRRYGLQDGVTVGLNSLLLFVVLFYVYPLKFLFTVFVNQFMGGTVVRLPGGAAVPVIETPDVWLLFVIYGLGFSAVYVIFALLHRHAWARRAELGLNELERFDTRAEILHYVLLASVGFLSVMLALLLDPRLAGIAGYAYFLIGVAEWAHGSLTAKRRRRLLQALATSPAAED